MYDRGVGHINSKIIYVGRRGKSAPMLGNMNHVKNNLKMYVIIFAIFVLTYSINKSVSIPFIVLLFDLNS